MILGSTEVIIPNQHASPDQNKTDKIGLQPQRDPQFVATNGPLSFLILYFILFI